VLVGVATLRTIRELVRQEEGGTSDPPRAWDLALWSGVTPQGSAESMDRLVKAKLVRVIPSSRPHRADAFRLDRGHPLVASLDTLFEAERAMCRSHVIGWDQRSPVERREELRRRRLKQR
jgi:hypothetical protein